MSCNRAKNVDIESFLIDAAVAEQVEFREHYPGCSDCSAAVAGWSRFDLAVRSTALSDGFSMGLHPDPALLETLVDLPASPLADVHAHVLRCPQCQTELSILRRFDASLLAVAAIHESIPVTHAEAVSFLDPIRRFFESLTESLGLAMSPAAVGGVVITLLAVTGIWMSGAFDRLRVDPSPPSGDLRVAERTPSGPETSGPGDGVQAAGVTVPTPIAATPSLEAEPLAAKEPSGAEPEVPATVEAYASYQIEKKVEPEPALPRLAEVRSTAKPSPEPSREVIENLREPEQPQIALSPRGLTTEREEILLAALTDLPLPTYGAAPGMDSRSGLRNFGATRGRGDAKVDSLAPDHVGLTLNSAPTFWWNLDADSELAIQITVVDEEAIEPVLRVELPGPHRAGMRSISLADHGVELAPGLEYRWFVTLLVDPDRPSRNPVSGGAIRVVSASDDRRGEIQAVEAAQRGHLLAKLGIWYDAYDFFAALCEAHPEIDALVRHRERLMELAKATP